jgi:hypothetical protein
MGELFLSYLGIRRFKGKARHIFERDFARRQRVYVYALKAQARLAGIGR